MGEVRQVDPITVGHGYEAPACRQAGVSVTGNGYVK